MPSLLSPAETIALLENESGHVFLDVRHPDRHAMARPESAVPNCVFEVAFLERMPSLAAPSTPIILCGETDSSGEASAAATKLERHGYRDVAILAGGFEAWRSAGLPVVGHGEPVPTPPFSGILALDPAECHVEWTGRNLLNNHRGTVDVRCGKLAFECGQLTGGRVVLDMTTLACTDLAGSALHDILIAHLADDDFFDTANHPQAILELDTLPVPLDGTPGSPNLDVSAILYQHAKLPSIMGPYHAFA